MTVTAHASRGGACHLRTSATPSGDTIDYAIKVTDCSTRFGVR
jgi:hypothetical protein